MNTLKNVSQFGLLLVALFVLAGCTSYKSGAVSMRDVSQYGNATTTGSVSVAAELLSTEARVKEVFYLDLPKESYYPVQVVAKNGTGNRLLLLKSSLSIQDTAGNVYRPANVATMIDAFEHNKMAYALLGFGIFSYMSADDANKKMASDWTSKELPTETILSPARSNSGFVYFKMPAGVKPDGMTLVVQVENLETKAVQDFRLRL